MSRPFRGGCFRCSAATTSGRVDVCGFGRWTFGVATIIVTRMGVTRTQSRPLEGTVHRNVFPTRATPKPLQGPKSHPETSCPKASGPGCSRVVRIRPRTPKIRPARQCLSFGTIDETKSTRRIAAAPRISSGAAWCAFFSGILTPPALRFNAPAVVCSDWYYLVKRSVFVITSPRFAVVLRREVGDCGVVV